MPTTSNFGWTTPADTDLVKDGAAAIRTLGNGIDTSLVDLKGGTTGQILSKASNTDLDYTWIANDQGDITEVQAGTGISVASQTGPIPVVTNTVATTFDAKGDLVVGTGADTFAKLPVGTNGYTLVADSSVSPQGLKWAVDPVADVVTTAGDLIYGTAADTVARLGIGTAGQVLKVNSGATAPEWGTASSTPTFVGASVSNSTTQSIANNTHTAVTWNTEQFDTDAFHSTSSNTSRFTIPAGKDGKYLFNCSVRWDDNAASDRILEIYKNGVIFAALDVLTGNFPGYMISRTLNLVATDYVELYVYQNSGGSRTLEIGGLRGWAELLYLGA